MLKRLIARYFSKDHALASITAMFIFIDTVLKEVLPHLPQLNLSAHLMAVIGLGAALSALVTGYLRKLPALTLAAGVTLIYQVVTLLIAAHVGEGGRFGLALITLASALQVAAKLTTAGDSQSPLATGAKATTVQPPTKTEE